MNQTIGTGRFFNAFEVGYEKKLQLQFGRTMCLANAVILLLGIGSSCAAQTRTPSTAPASQVKTIAAIGQDIANLKAKFPQLREFSVSKNVLSRELIIDYYYHAHWGPTIDSGPSAWGSRIQTDDDGVWLHIDFHPGPIDPTDGWPEWQPGCFEDKGVSFVIFEGHKTSSAWGEIEEILKRHGVKPCADRTP